MRLSRYHVERRKRRTSIRVIAWVAKEALAANDSQRTMSMGMIGMGRDGKKQKKQRKKHGLLLSRTRAQAAANKRAYRFGQSKNEKK